MRPLLSLVLADIGVQPFLIASSVIAIMAQRLVRVNCVKCKKPYKPTEGEMRAAAVSPEQLAKATFMTGHGAVATATRRAIGAGWAFLK